ncbi:MAG TPA: UMP kinase [Candidatus Diapherotrites archaeon]|uniref:UMP kinase n=1 Tax=Candidatus Iainarchaeum sp. TaxID=3101447 RepID=A0A7J4IYE8_9ARCH|nr:UMP kinase [Candidatus Diapherotrites archaeon]
MFDIFENVLKEQEQTPHESAQPAANANMAYGNSGDVFVVSVGGSLLIDESGPDAGKIRQIAGTISSLHSAGKRLVLVVGGGKTARSYVEAMRSLNANNFTLDMLGIHITRANAMLVAGAIPAAHPQILTEITQARQALDTGKIPVFGGLMPFFTTDSVGALLAEYLGGRFVNLTNVDGVYDSNPNENPGAKMLEEIGYRRLISMVVAAGSKPGQNVVLDLAACLILQRSNIPAVVLNGNDMPNFSNYLNGYSFKGTVIRDIIDAQGDEIVASGPQDLGDAEFSEKDEKPKRSRKKAVKKGGKNSPISPYDIDF